MILQHVNHARNVRRGARTDHHSRPVLIELQNPQAGGQGERALPPLAFPNRPHLVVLSNGNIYQRQEAVSVKRCIRELRWAHGS